MIKITRIRVYRAGTIGYVAGKREEKKLAEKIKILMNKLELEGEITLK